ncbi:glycosyltransferase family 2 protein [Tuwongella immobilis]|uniref:Glycosyltransferase 2-like domain-containing protein n=1 Tax=Tuwongella immobilis TaxID=692036 RepID=A0A6C2YTU0_9BACT|nr:glycosyltransferase family 2 protein [Tuwongella immobilis]VIP04335.1 Undecaprenyl-phosphate glycosyltransferase, DPM1-like family OS=Geobacter metallireducens (strain GS-15 / ATCC 53774 / DSM 7210) GN=Gmet_2892 PE=4 SV=1: Glycos_transf_2 [Tuwongella immobilis]VTS06032.1 Undecaprenyl-phosphate glycosyltransferase, DPM1-like family OS=Geobacter metallireducens (strain GS-15 / ATCC 53774 / DSM 7210) GN=Gmet_2892 PE=4 SV=1: Glycos_transf_2 [Tuwongella immobilis]
MKTLSIVIPIKDERENLAPLFGDILAALEHRLGWEVVFVDDGSTDGSFAVLDELANRYPQIRVVRLRRNVGQSAALQAGIDASRGDIIVTMDGDRQNDPADIPLLVAKLEEGFDVVLGQRAKRQDGFILRLLPSLIANWMIRKITKVPFRDFGCTLRAMTREIATSVRLYGEMHRYLTVMSQQLGARITQIPVRHHPRIAGKSKYNLTRTIRVVLDLITIKFLDGYLTRPMHCFGLAGLIMLMLGTLSLSATTIMKLVNGIDMTGNPLLLLTVLLMTMGIQFISMGLLGEVLIRTYFESSGRRPYTIRETRNLPPATPSRHAS